MAISTGVLSAGAPSGSLVSIEATQPVTAEPAPNILVVPGEFTIRREGGALDQSLPVWIAFGGTATPGADYARLPDRVEFGPGEVSISLQVLGVDDDELEEDETVIASVYDPTLGPVPLFEVDPARARATVTINDTDRLFPSSEVRIEATRRVAEETAAPLRRINLVGEFTVSRSLPTIFALPVWIHISGTATPGDDYEPIPILVQIPAGERSVSFPVTALFDEKPEGIETVIATVSNCPPDGLRGPCYNFRVDEAHASATVFIREDGLSIASLHINRPSSGDHFAVREPILIQATAIHLQSYISSVEFWAGDTKIGFSEVVFVRAPDPGTPLLHQFEWQDAPAGTHLLTVRTKLVDPNGAAGHPPLVSSPVHITVGDGGENQDPEAEIASPAAGDQFPAGEPINIVVRARDPDGYIPQVELFADGLKIGEMNISFFVESPLGQPQTFTFTWKHPLPGPHVLTARVTDNEGASSESAPVEIRVTPPEPGPIVNVVARDALAVEPGPNGTVNTATFRIRRHGSTSGEFEVRYHLAGRARNGVDYERLSGTALIPDGSAWVDVTVVPLSDQERERPESVKLALAEDPTFRVGFPHHAFAVIYDRPWPHPPGLPRCVRLADGLIHLCFPAPTGICFRFEGSPDLRHWTTLICLIPVDGSIHFVDETTPGFPHRYFRIAPEPNGLPGE